MLACLKIMASVDKGSSLWSLESDRKATLHFLRKQSVFELYIWNSQVVERIGKDESLLSAIMIFTKCRRLERCWFMSKLLSLLLAWLLARLVKVCVESCINSRRTNQEILTDLLLASPGNYYCWYFTFIILTKRGRKDKHRIQGVLKNCFSFLLKSALSSIIVNSHYL